MVCTQHRHQKPRRWFIRQSMLVIRLPVALISGEAGIPSLVHMVTIVPEARPTCSDLAGCYTSPSRLVISSGTENQVPAAGSAFGLAMDMYSSLSRDCASTRPILVTQKAFDGPLNREPPPRATSSDTPQGCSVSRLNPSGPKSTANP